MTQSHRVLLCLRYGIGDVVMEMPALRGLRAAIPDAEITVLGARPALELFEGDPDFQALICIHDFGFRHWGDLGDADARQRFHEWFVNAGFSCVYDPFHAVFGAQNSLTQSGVPWRNCDTELRQPDQLTGGHGIAAIWECAVEQWDLANQRHRQPPAPTLHLPDSARESARQRLASWSADETRETIGIAPIASSELKRWPLENMLDVIRWLIDDRQKRVLIFGLGEDDSSFRQAVRGVADEADLAVLSQTHLQETAALVSHCRAFVSNDTGLMHLAACVGVPTVGIFGPTAAHIYLPYDSLAVTSNRPCDYRLHEYFGPPRCVHEDRCLIAERGCIHDIPVEAVQLALNRLMGTVPVPETETGWQLAPENPWKGSSMGLGS
ncbi:glycosyltransferase family 9 protein [Proteobacteria bacterium 005FR1]|nr:glycosyltransferase family 9 protein [Proteobacteria bacterium 005FR1]